MDKHTSMRGVEIIQALATPQGAYLISHDEVEDKTVTYEARLVADSTGWTFFKSGSDEPISSGIYTTAWVAVSEEPAVAGLSLKNKLLLATSELPDEETLRQFLEHLRTMKPNEEGAG